MLILTGLSAYASIVFAATMAELALIHFFDIQVIKQSGVCVTEVQDLLYFNFITILTVGYGDYAPFGVGRVISILESLSGLIVFGAFTGVFVIKLMLPRKDTIVFSKYCYYDDSKARFVIQFVNTANLPLVNVEMCSLLKLGRDWVLRPSYTSPYIGSSAWTFSINRIDDFPGGENFDDFRQLTLYQDDGIKFGIVGTIGFATFSSTIKYNLDQVIVIKSKRELTDQKSLKEPDFSSQSFIEAFHYIPENAENFLQFAKKRGSKIHKEAKRG